MEFLKRKDTDCLMLINTIYHKGTKASGYKDYLDIVYKDLKTGEKHVETLDEPKMEIFISQEGKRNFKHNKTFEYLKNVETHKVAHRNVAKYIANQAGGTWKTQFNDCLRNGNFGAAQNIHKFPYVFGSDIDIESFYRINWTRHYDNERAKKPTKIYADIEVDGIDISGFPKDGNCPVNAYSIFDEETMTMYTMLLRNPDNPLIEEFEKDIDGFVRELHADFDESYGSVQYRIYMYDEEIDLIKDSWALINTLKRDFCLFWNGYGFDYPFLIDRMKVLGMDPVETACHKDFTVKEFFHYKDTRNFAVNMKKDYVKCSSYTIFADQMIYYAQLRKGQSTLRSNSLSFISQHELKDNKLDYHEEADIKTLPYKNFKLFVAYNIKDVLLQYGIERKTSDVDGIYQRAYSNFCPYHKVFAQTFFLKARGYNEYYLQGFIMGNNINVTYGEPYDNAKKKIGFAGAIVGDPELNDRTGAMILGRTSKYVFKWVVDFDFWAMYPYIIICFNMAPNTLIGKLFVNESPADLMKQINKLNASDLKEDDADDDETDDGEVGVVLEDMGKDFIDNLLTGDVASTGSKWFNLPNINEIVERLKVK